MCDGTTQDMEKSSTHPPTVWMRGHIGTTVLKEVVHTLPTCKSEYLGKALLHAQADMPYTLFTSSVNRCLASQASQGPMHQIIVALLSGKSLLFINGKMETW